MGSAAGLPFSQEYNDPTAFFEDLIPSKDLSRIANPSAYE